MVQNGSKWSNFFCKMVKNGEKLSKMAKNHQTGLKWPKIVKIVKNDKKLSKMAKNGSKWSKMVQNGLNW